MFFGWLLPALRFLGLADAQALGRLLWRDRFSQSMPFYEPMFARAVGIDARVCVVCAWSVCAWCAVWCVCVTNERAEARPCSC